MLVDLLSPANYLMINKDAIKILGLNTAVYCSELLTIYKKVVTKKKFINEEKYFQVDREYIKKQTSLEIDEQLKCDINLAKVNIIKIDSDNPNIIYFDVETFSSVLASEDIKLLDAVSSKVKVANPRGSKEANNKYVIQELKNSIECNTPDVLFALRDWIDAIFGSNKGLSKVQIRKFKERLDDYCNGDIKMALEIINIAIVHAYIDCQWAINLFERGNKLPANKPNNNNRSALFNTVPEQRRTTSVSGESF